MSKYSIVRNITKHQR